MQTIRFLRCVTLIQYALDRRWLCWLLAEHQTVHGVLDFPALVMRDGFATLDFRAFRNPLRICYVEFREHVPIDIIATVFLDLSARHCGLELVVATAAKLRFRINETQAHTHTA